MNKLNTKFKKALVTGGAGFVGSHLVDSLLAEGLEVISIDDYSAGKRENLVEARKNSKFLEVECDITDYESLEKHFDGVDVVFHNAASKMTICLNNPARDLDVNAKGALNILEACRKYSVKKVVHTSTGSVYGKVKHYPTDEEHSVYPVSHYGVSKLAGERYAFLYEKNYDLDVSILRYYHVYGPRQDSSDVGGVVNIFARRVSEGQPPKIFGDGTQVRTFTYVQDIVSINKLVAMSENSRGHAYNCSSNEPTTIRELADNVLEFFNRQDLEIQYSDWKIGDIKDFDVSNSKIKKLGHKFETKFSEGLTATLSNFVENSKKN